MEIHPPTSDIKEEYDHVNMIRKVASKYCLSLKALCNILGISTSIIYRKQSTLNKDVTEHLLRLDKLFETARQYFGNEKSARHWFANYNRGLAVIPIELCDTFSGIDRTEESIVKLMHGMTA